MQTGDLANGTKLVGAHCSSCKPEVLFDPIRLNDVGEAKVIRALGRGQVLGPLTDGMVAASLPWKPGMCSPISVPVRLRCEI